MKKTLSLLLAVLMLFGVISFSAFAEEEDNYAPEQYSDAEYAAGFSFKYIYVVIKNEYSFQEFTPEMLSAELVSKVEAPYSFNPDNSSYNKDTWELLLIVYLKEQTKENVIELYRTMKESEYVSEIELGFIYTYLPIYPDSPEEIGFYSGKYKPRVTPDNEDYIAAGSCMIRNPYYQIYYNELLAHSVSVYEQFADYMGDVDYISYFAENYMNNEENYVTLIFNNQIGLPDEEGAVRDYNMSVLSKYFSEEEILYVSDVDLAAVVEISNENSNIIKEIEELAFIGDAFFTFDTWSLAVIGEYTLGNVVGQQAQVYYDDPALNVPLKRVSAADARVILRYAAGLEKPEKELKRFYYCADMNFDGEINSSDARIALRTAAGLKKEHTVMFGTSDQWGDLMGTETKWW